MLYKKVFYLRNEVKPDAAQEEDFWKDEMTAKEFVADRWRTSRRENDGCRGESLEGKVSQSAINSLRND